MTKYRKNFEMEDEENGVFGWKLEKEVSSWDALMGEELLNQEAILEGAIHSIRNMGDVAFVIIRKEKVCSDSICK